MKLIPESEAVEIMAKALHTRDEEWTWPQDPDARETWDLIQPYQRQRYLDQAQAVLDALRELGIYPAW